MDAFASPAQLVPGKKYFTHKLGLDSIFIDVSVNGSDFVKCSTRSLSTSRRDYGQSAVLELFVRNQAKISIKFTDKEPIFDDLSVSKKHFTDKPTFSGDLSVNFCPL